jgi:methylated-DNA-[protein]-cysteine S-methyltransferase
MAEVLHLLVDHVSTPIGMMRIAADEGGSLRVAFFAEGEDEILRYLRRQYGKDGFTLEPAVNPYGTTQAIERYFAGDLGAIDDLPVQAGGTDFQREVWRALRRIPCGTTTSYGKLARQIGRPEAVRAVGLANGANPIAVVVPCHRVIGSDGSLTGYGGGIERKRWLLQHEQGGTGSLLF